MSYINPYYGLNFFGFLSVLFQRFFGLIVGADQSGLVADEIQILVLLGVAATAGMVGCFLHLRKMAMLANALSHTILVGLIVVFLVVRYLNGASGDHSPLGGLTIFQMVIAALISGVMTTFITDFVRRTLRLQADASTGLVFSTLFAFGITLVTLYARNVHIGTEVVMGNVDALSVDDCSLVAMIFFVNLFLIVLFFKEYQITTFDPNLANTLGIRESFYNYLLMFQVSLTCVAAFRAVGVLMVLAFLIGPPLTARLLTDRLKLMLVLSVGIGCFASLIGVSLARHLLSVNGLALSTAGLVVCVIVALYLIVLTLRRFLLCYFLVSQRTKS